MFQNSKARAAAARYNDRKEAEDSADRLKDIIPTLETLKFQIQHEAGGYGVAEPGYVRHVMVATAPALFLIPCGGSNCTNGGHDITLVVMRALHAASTKFDGTDICYGEAGTGSCERVLSYSATASFGSD